MKQMKDSGIEWIGEIPENWMIGHLKYFCKLSGGSQYTSNDFVKENQGALILSPSNFSDGKMNYEQCSYISWDKYYKNPNTHVSNGDILYVKTGSTYGKVCQLYDLPCDSTINPQILALKDINIDPKFLNYYMSSTAVRSQTDISVTGGTIPTISQERIANYFIPIPPLNDQNKISNFLDSKISKIKSLIDNLNVQIDKLKDYKKALITKCVTKGLDSNVPLKDSGIEWIGKIPEHYSVIKIKKIGVARNGLTYQPSDITDETGVLVLRSSNVKNGRLSLSDNVYVSCKVPEKLMVKRNDILICSRNGSKQLIGKNAIIDNDVVASFGAFMMIFRCSTNAKYVKYILDSEIFNYYLGSFLTSTINQLTNENFLNMKIVYCSDSNEQEQIIAYLDKKCSEIDSLISSKQQQIDKLNEYQKSLIYEYVTGKKEVV